jgi:hypothetical protein
MSGPCGHPASELRIRPNGVRDCLTCRREREKRRRDTERAVGLRRPLVLSAARCAVEQAAWLLPDRVLENVVTERIEAGAVRRGGRGGGFALVNIGVADVEVAVATSASGRPAYKPLRLVHRLRGAS